MYSVAIIGAGNMGAFYDSPQSPSILSHAHAFQAHPEFDLVGFVDSDRDRARKAADLWGGRAFGSVEELFAAEGVDGVVIAVADSAHFDVFKAVASYPVRFICLEKPIALHMDQASSMVALAEQKKITVLVNYSRRFLADYVRLKEDIHAGVYGRFLGGTGLYGKGLLHNGSHMLDLLQYFLGVPRLYCRRGPLVDFSPQDPTLSALLKWENNTYFNLMGIDSRHFTIFEMDLLFSRGRIHIQNSGALIELYGVEENAQYQGYKNLVKTTELRIDLTQSLPSMVNNLHDTLQNNAPPRCTLEDGMRALELCLSIRDSE